MCVCVGFGQQWKHEKKRKRNFLDTRVCGLMINHMMMMMILEREISLYGPFTMYVCTYTCATYNILHMWARVYLLFWFFFWVDSVSTKNPQSERFGFNFYKLNPKISGSNFKSENEIFVCCLAKLFRKTTKAYLKIIQMTNLLIIYIKTKCSL